MHLRETVSIVAVGRQLSLEDVAVLSAGGSTTCWMAYRNSIPIPGI